MDDLWRELAARRDLLESLKAIVLGQRGKARVLRHAADVATLGGHHERAEALRHGAAYREAQAAQTLTEYGRIHRREPT